MAPSSRGRLKWPGSRHGRSGWNTTRRKCCLTVGVRGEIIRCNPQALRTRHLDHLVKDGRLQRAFPANPTHEKQAYRATGKQA